MRLRLTIPALADLDEVYDALTREAGESAAEKHAEAFRATFERLQAFPHSGKPAEQYRPGLRETQAKRYRVFYRVQPGYVEITRVLHQRRDVRPEMFQ